jgi:hypothetical protein
MAAAVGSMAAAVGSMAAAYKHTHTHTHSILDIKGNVLVMEGADGRNGSIAIRKMNGML